MTSTDQLGEKAVLQAVTENCSTRNLGVMSRYRPIEEAPSDLTSILGNRQCYNARPSPIIRSPLPLSKRAETLCPTVPWVGAVDLLLLAVVADPTCNGQARDMSFRVLPRTC